jgi:hypothetical protein
VRRAVRSSVTVSRLRRSTSVVVIGGKRVAVQRNRDLFYTSKKQLFAGESYSPATSAADRAANVAKMPNRFQKRLTKRGREGPF